MREIREGLKRKWDEINREYQKITHVRLVDTTGLKRRKEGYEKELAEIEADIKKLNKLYVFVDWLFDSWILIFMTFLIQNVRALVCLAVEKHPSWKLLETFDNNPYDRILSIHPESLIIDYSAAFSPLPTVCLKKLNNFWFYCSLSETLIKISLKARL